LDLHLHRLSGQNRLWQAQGHDPVPVPVADAVEAPHGEKLLFLHPHAPDPDPAGDLDGPVPDGPLLVEVLVKEELEDGKIVRRTVVKPDGLPPG
jgi:hypothetical protein